MHDSTVSTIFRGDPVRAHQIPILALHEHAKGLLDRELVQSYVLKRDVFYHIDVMHNLKFSLLMV
jgi:hypothetical protein